MGNDELIQATQDVWAFVLKKQLQVSLEKNIAEFHLKVDLSHLRVGYVLYIDDRKEGVAVGLRSKGTKDYRSSSYLSEFCGVVLSLEDTKKIGTKGKDCAPN